MSWRPPEEVWEKLIKDNLMWSDRDSLEAGADIMLEGLKGERYILAIGGKWVFIPEEKEDGTD